MIAITDLHKKFYPGTANEVYALRGIDLKVNAGDFVTIIGTNGSGKSTLLNAVAGTFLPDSGRIEIAGKDTTYRKDYQRVKFVSRVFQNPFMGTAPDMTIAENLHTAWLRGRHKKPKIGLNGERRRAYREAVAQLEMQLENRLDNLIGTLSGGQRQALTLLMAVISEPKVLLLDEHTAALDPKTAVVIMRLTDRIVREKKLTALMVTHNLRYALEYGGRILMMHQGGIVLDRSGEEKRGLSIDDVLKIFNEISVECGN